MTFLEIDVVKQLVAEFRRCGRKFRSNAWIVHAGLSVAMPLIGMYVNLLYYVKNFLNFHYFQGTLPPSWRRKQTESVQSCRPYTSFHCLKYRPRYRTSLTCGSTSARLRQLEGKAGKINNEDVVYFNFTWLFYFGVPFQGGAKCGQRNDDQMSDMVGAQVSQFYRNNHRLVAVLR